MSRAETKPITACCTDSGAALKLSFGAAEITGEIRAGLDKRLPKKGVSPRWVQETENPELLVRVVSIDQGNQFLRWLLPFIAPATLEVEGHVSVGDAAPRDFHYTQRAQMGLLGGAAKGMLKVCAQRVADKITGDVSRQMKR
jgi:hypothetical protein